MGEDSFNRRRLRGDLLEMYKIVTGNENVVYTIKFFQFVNDDHGLRGH